MSDEDVGMVLGCIAVLRNNDMTKEQVLPYYEKLLQHHSITPEDVNKNALALTLTGKVASYSQAVDHLRGLFPDLVVK